jgi:predicted regulator of Ras-like GTPase activity (Roadblock/LC7/MglB family)
MNSPGFSADLTSFDLLDLVQVIHLDRHDLCLVLRAGSQTLGVLRFRQGELLWAEFGEMTGEAAFMALATQQYGNLEQLPWTDTGERNVYQPLSRLIMQAVAYRDQQQGAGEEDAWGSEGWGQPQEMSEQQPPLSAQPGNGYHPFAGSGPVSPVMVEMEDVEMPDWMRHVYPSVEEIAAQPTGAMPLPTISRPAPAAPPRSSAGPHTPPPLPAAPTGDQAAQPTGSFSMLNGKRSLPGLLRGAPRNEALPTSPAPEDPPTVPLPSVQGSFMEYALRRDQPVSLPLEEQGTKPLPGSEPEPLAEPESLLDEEMTGRGATSILTALASAGSLATAAAPGNTPDLEEAVAAGAVLPGTQGEEQQERVSTPALPAPIAPIEVGLQPAMREPEGAKPSSLSLLEQLAYGSARNAHAAEVAASPIEVGLPVANLPAVSALNGAAMAAPAAESAAAAVAESAAEAAVAEAAESPLSEPALRGAGRPNSRYISASSPARRSLISAPSSVNAPASAAGAEAGSGILVWPLSVETTRKLQETQEGFAMQVGPAFLATAILRADGTLVAQHVANKRIEQDLSSPAYHLAHVMQSSLRALLMGGWGDLDETLITGSTHTVVLRRLGWAEKGLFHMAVLERSGNHGLCRVLMRNTEPILLQLLTPQ